MELLGFLEFLWALLWHWICWDAFAIVLTDLQNLCLCRGIHNNNYGYIKGVAHFSHAASAFWLI